MPAVFKAILGVFITFGLHIIVWLILEITTGYLTYIPTLSGLNYALTLYKISLGLSQLIYVFPLVWWLARRQKFSWMRGIIIGAVITALLNGGLWLIVLFVLS